MGRFKPVIKTQVVPPATNTSSSIDNKNNNSTAPPTPPHNESNTTSTTPTVVSVSTQKGRKNQKVTDGQIKKATTPRKRKNKKTATVEEADSGKISNSDETKPNVAMATPEGSTPASTPKSTDDVSPIPVPTKATRKRKSKSDKNSDNLQFEANNHGESKSKRARKPKDPNAPKRPPNAYLQFTISKRAELKQQNPGMSPKEITIMLGEAWRKMSEAQKKPYYDLVTQALAQWQEDMKAYQVLNNVGFVQDNREQNTAQTNESADMYSSSAVQNSLDMQLVSDNGINNLPEIIASNNTNTIDGLYQLPANSTNSTCVTYDSHGQGDSMEDLLDMPYNSQAYGYDSTNTDMNGTHLYADNINTNYSLSSTMIPIQVGIVDQYAHGSYFTQDFISTHQEQEQHQVVKQDLLLCQPFDPSGVNQELESNTQENSIIQKQEKPDTNNMLLCQPFEPPNDNKVVTDNDNNDNSWLQDGTQYQDQQTQQEYSKYSQIPQQFSQQMSIHEMNNQFISSSAPQEHAPQYPVHQGISQEIPYQELQHIGMYQHQLHQHNPASEMNHLQYLSGRQQN